MRDLPEYLPWEQAQETIKPANLLWVPRSEAEANQNLTQIIPSAIITAQHRQYHTFKRCSSDFEQLADKLSIIIGGHCDFEDIPTPDADGITATQPAASAQDYARVFQRAMTREVQEEVSFQVETIIEPTALVTDRTTPKTAQHTALIYQITCHRRLYAQAPEEFVTNPAHNGVLRNIDELLTIPHQLDPWTRIIVQALSSVGHTC